MDYWDMIRLFPIIMNFISISAVIVSELYHKYPVELDNQIREEIYSNEVIASAARQCGLIMVYGNAIESTNFRDLSPSTVTRYVIVWLMAYMASPSLCRVAKVTAMTLFEPMKNDTRIPNNMDAMLLIMIP